MPESSTEITINKSETTAQSPEANAADKPAVQSVAKTISVLCAIAEDAALFEKARLLQSKAAEFGFDWPSVEPIFEKLKEEVAELKVEITEALASESFNDYHRMRVQDELGDVLFCCVNLARFMGVDAAKALDGTNEKFERRFQFIEQAVAVQGKRLKALPLEELDRLWNAAKAQGL